MIAQKVSLSGYSLVYWFSGPERAIYRYPLAALKDLEVLGGELWRFQEFVSSIGQSHYHNLVQVFIVVLWEQAYYCIEASLHIVSSSSIHFVSFKHFHILPKCYEILISFLWPFIAFFVFEDSLPNCFPSNHPSMTVSITLFHRVFMFVSSVVPLGKYLPLFLLLHDS